MNHISLTSEELIAISQEAENRYVGVSCGKLDQSCEIYCRKDHLLYMDMQDDSFELIPTHKDAKPYKFAIFFSGLERSLASSKFNMRVDECKSAAYALMAYAGMGLLGEVALLAASSTCLRHLIAKPAFILFDTLPLSPNFCSPA